LRPALLGLSSAALFAASAIGYRSAILACINRALCWAQLFRMVGLSLQTLLLAWLLSSSVGFSALMRL
jgi:hypothetical protein